MTATRRNAPPRRRITTSDTPGRFARRPTHERGRAVMEIPKEKILELLPGGLGDKLGL